MKANITLCEEHCCLRVTIRDFPQAAQLHLSPCHDNILARHLRSPSAHRSRAGMVIIEMYSTQRSIQNAQGDTVMMEFAARLSVDVRSVGQRNQVGWHLCL